MAPGLRKTIGTQEENYRIVKRKLLFLSIKSQFQSLKLTFDAKKKKLSDNVSKISWSVPITFLKPGATVPSPLR